DAASCDDIFHRFCRTLEVHRTTSLCDRDVEAAELRAVHALHVHHVSTIVEDGDEHFPAVASGFGMRRRGDVFGDSECERSFGSELKSHISASLAHIQTLRKDVLDVRSLAVAVLLNSL